MQFGDIHEELDVSFRLPGPDKSATPKERAEYKRDMREKARAALKAAGFQIIMACSKYIQTSNISF